MRFVHRRSGGGSTEHEDQQGFVVPMVVMSLVAILLLATLALDGSMAYPQRRSAQNAADAAAVSGAQAMDRATWFGGSAAEVYDEALGVAKDNGADRITCEFFRMRQPWEVPGDPTVSMGRCLPTTTAIPVYVDEYGMDWYAQGVRITAEVDRATTFGALSGSPKVTARAGAAASVQKLKTTGSPFIVCANPAPALAPPPGTLGFDLLKTDPPVVADWSVYSRPWDPPFVFNPDGTVDLDPAKVAIANNLNKGRGMPLVGSEPRVPRCGVGGGNFDGNGSYEVVTVPSWISYDSGGGHSAAAAEQVVSSTPCPDPLPANYDANLRPCDILLPIAIDGDASANPEVLRVVAMAVFRITGNGLGNPKYYGQIRTDVHYASGGASTIDPVTAASMRVVRLLE